MKILNFKTPVFFVGLAMMTLVSCQKDETQEQITEQNSLEELKNELQIDDTSKITIDNTAFYVSEITQEQIDLLGSIKKTALHKFHGLMDMETRKFESIQFYSDVQYLPEDLHKAVSGSNLAAQKQTCFDDARFWVNASMQSGTNGGAFNKRYFCGLGASSTLRSAHEWIGLSLNTNTRRKISVTRNGRFWIEVRPDDYNRTLGWYKTKDIKSDEVITTKATLVTD